MTIDPNDSNTIWVGTGENVSGRHVGYGDGVYRSRDGGQSWENMGLEDSEHIGMIRIDPRDSDTIFVAAQGPLWSGGGDRGLYKSTDGGESWRKVLGNGLGNTEIDDRYTGVSEVHMDPRNPDVMYAVAWQRFRNVAVVMDGGPGTGIYKSQDGGETWRELTEGLPEENMGKTGLAISPQDPDVIYATIELDNRTGGFWRSADGGETWQKLTEFRVAVGARTGVATTLGWGPRFLHSTGQLHKGGPNSGVFIQFVDPATQSVDVPETDHDFGSLVRAQAAGDHQALVEAGRRVIRIDRGANPDQAIDQLTAGLT